MTTIQDKNLLRLDSITSLMKEVIEHIETIQDEDEYKRVRDYLNSRFDIGLPYTSPFIKKEEKTS